MVFSLGVLITRRRRLPSTEQLPPVVDFLRALVPELSKELLKGGVRVKKARWREGGRNQEWAWWTQWGVG